MTPKLLIKDLQVLSLKIQQIYFIVYIAKNEDLMLNMLMLILMNAQVVTT